MRRILSGAMPLALLVCMASSEASAQSRIAPFFGGGMISPTGDFGDYAKTGWGVFGGFNYSMPASPQMSMGLTAFYGHAEHEGSSGEATDLPGIFGELGYSIGTGSIRPYVRASLGFLQHKYDAGSSGYGSETETNFAFGVGGGIGKSFGNTSLFAGAQYMGGDTQFLTFYAGLGFGGGGSSSARRF